MDDIALNPDFYDLFRDQALVITTFAWLFAVLAARLLKPRVADVVFYMGAVMVSLAVIEPVFFYLKAKVPALAEETKLAWRAGSSDPLRERDPFYALLRVYLKANPEHPLTVVATKEGDTIRWAKYYLAPRPVVVADGDQLAGFLPNPGEPARWVLATGMPRVPAEAEVAIEGRVDDWILFRLQHRGNP